jgi:hypothetical protein
MFEMSMTLRHRLSTDLIVESHPMPPLYTWPWIGTSSFGTTLQLTSPKSTKALLSRVSHAKSSSSSSTRASTSHHSRHGHGHHACCGRDNDVDGSAHVTPSGPDLIVLLMITMQADHFTSSTIVGGIVTDQSS